MKTEMKIGNNKLSSAISILLIGLFIISTMGAIPSRNAPQGGAATVPNAPSTSTPMVFNATLHGRGATFPAPFLTAATSAYHTQNPNVLVQYNVNVPATGSGAGQKAFMNKTDDFDASDAPLSSAQRELTPGVLHIPETIGSVTLSYNIPGAPQGLNITGAIIAQIYMGTILNWNDPALQSINPGFVLPAHSITTVHRSDSSGTTFILTSFLSLDSSAWASSIGAGTVVNWPGSPTGSPPPIALTGNGNGGVASVIASTAYSFGYVELNYALQNNFHYCQVQNPTGSYILPSLQTTSFAVQNSTSILPSGGQSWAGVSMLNRPGSQTYPIASFTYLLVYQELNVIPLMDMNETFQATALINFLYWLVNNGGQSLAPGLSYVPLPAFVRTIDNASIASITFTTPPKVSRTIHLTAAAVGGWNATTSNPNPTITIYSGDTVTLVLTSTDGAPHQLYVDYNHNGVFDPNEVGTNSTLFSSTSPTTMKPFTAAIGINVPRAGNFTYRDDQNPANSGTIQIIQQQVGAAISEPSALTASLNKIDTSKVSTVGTLVINMRTLQFSGTVGEIAVDSTSGSITFAKNYTVTNLQLHTVPNQAGVLDRFLLNAQVVPYPLSSIIFIQLTGTTATVNNQITREVDMAANGFVSIVDVGVVFADFGFSVGQPQYNPQADLVAAGTVNLVSVSIVALDYGSPVFR